MAGEASAAFSPGMPVHPYAPPMAKEIGDEQPLDEQILWRLEDGIAWITLNRPDAQNALTPDQRDRLIELLAQASADVATRVVVLSGRGKGFCTGADLRASRPAPARPEGAPDRVAGD